VVGAQIVREYTHVYAAVSPLDGVLDSLILPEVTTEMFSFFLDEVAKRHCRELIVMFLDKAGWHTAKALTIPENVRLCYLPPYSPELNPAEHLWDEIREKWFPNLVFHHMDGVEDALMEVLIVLENDPDRVRSLTGFDWIINAILIAT
jgi:transposase